jgi:hypothetical protein
MATTSTSPTFTIHMTDRFCWLCAKCAAGNARGHKVVNVDVGSIRPKEGCNDCGGGFETPAA